MSGLQKLRTDLRIVSSDRSFQIVCGVVSGLLHSAVWFQLPELLKPGSPHVVVNRFRSGLFGVPESLLMQSGQCLPSHSFCSVAKFVLESCVSVNLAYIK